MTHALPEFEEDRLILDYLDRIGVRRATYRGPARERETAAASVYLYDLSDPSRLAGTTGETYPLPPRRRAVVRGAWSC